MVGTMSPDQFLVLPAQSTTASAADVYTSIKAVEGRPLLIDASQVERLGALVVQIILAAEKFWENQALQFAITTPSDAFIMTGKRLGLAHLLDTDAEAEIQSCL